jgi:bisphosphoglycerate-independent phosphoglycerate mutase (AlkP superfamily)
MYDPEIDAPHTAHTMNPVPFAIYAPHDRAIQHLKLDTRENRGLQHIAATVLELMGIVAQDELEQSLIIHA